MNVFRGITYYLVPFVENFILIVAVRKLDFFFLTQQWLLLCEEKGKRQSWWWEENFSSCLFIWNEQRQTLSGHIDCRDILFHLILLLSWLSQHIHVTDMGQQILCSADLLICQHFYERSKLLYHWTSQGRSPMACSRSYWGTQVWYSPAFFPLFYSVLFVQFHLLTDTHGAYCLKLLSVIKITG